MRKSSITYVIRYLGIAMLTWTWSNTPVYAKKGVPPSEPLPAPNDLEVAVHSSEQLNLTWTYAGPSVQQFQIERAPDSQGSWSRVATVKSHVTSYQDKGLNAASTYFYRMRAKQKTSIFGVF